MSYETELKIAWATLAVQDEKLAVIINKHGPCTLKPHTDYYGSLVSAIIGQQLSEKAGSTIEKRFRGLYEDKLPNPEQIMTTNPDSIRQIGVSYGKISYMKDLATHIIDGRLDLCKLSSESNINIIAKLTDIKGIGEWTAQMFLIFSLGRLDVLPTGDLGVRKSMMRVYELAEMPDPKTMKDIAVHNNWTGYESIASWYLWRNLDNQ